MYTSGEFLRTVEYVDKKRFSLPIGEAFEKLKRTFQNEMRDVPSGLTRELFTYFIGPFGTEDSVSEELVARAHQLGDVIDLFHEAYGSENDDLAEEDWLFIRETTNEYAEELDLDILTSVMSMIVEQGYL